MIFIKSGMIRCTFQQDSPSARREEGLISEADVGQSLTTRKETSVWQGNPGTSPDAAEVTQMEFGRHLRHEWAKLRQFKYWDKEVCSFIFLITYIMKTFSIFKGNLFIYGMRPVKLYIIRLLSFKRDGGMKRLALVAGDIHTPDPPWLQNLLPTSGCFEFKTLLDMGTLPTFSMSVCSVTVT